MGSKGNLSAKIDGSPAVVWGTDPKDGRFFVGTKSVFHEILTACFRWLPSRDKTIYQGDFIGFGGTHTWTPNTLTYTIPTVASEQIVIAPHTTYYEGVPYPLHNNLSDRSGFVKFILNDDKEVTALKKELNSYIREGKEIKPQEFANSRLVFLWKLVSSLKEDYMDTCKVDDELQVTLNGSSHEGEGFVKFNEWGHIKLVRRGSFSYANFNNPRFVRS